MKTTLMGMTAVLFCAASLAADFTFDEQPGCLLVRNDGKPWLGTVVTPFDPGKREDTYKVYTHIYDFAGTAPITKGPGGKYPHHRGMFIGWMHTNVGGQDLDTWGMGNTSQRHVSWLDRKSSAESAVQSERIDWCNDAGKPFIEETRTIAAKPGVNGIRVFDFQSTLKSVAGPIQLRGNVQHAGMHIRMEQEVVDHEGTTQYIMPEGAQEQKDDEVTGAWWMCCSPEVRGTRYWVLHMTPKSLPKGPPVYSVRRYARFGAFFEPDLADGQPSTFSFRVVLSDKPLDRAACDGFYADYMKTMP